MRGRDYLRAPSVQARAVAGRPHNRHHLPDQQFAFSNLLPEGTVVINVADDVAAMLTGKGAVGSIALQPGGALRCRRSIQTQL